MESAFSYLSGLVEAFEDVGKKNQNKKKETQRSAWNQAGIPSCNINVTNSTDDFYCGGAGYNEYDVEGQNLQDGDDGIIQQPASNVSSKRRRQRSSTPSISEKRSFSGIVKSRGASILQSFSAGSSNRHDALNVPDVSKSHSSLSNTTNESMTDVDEIEHDDMSFDSQDFAEHHPSKSRRYPKLPPPPSRYHIQWFAHGVMWTCMAIFCGWMAVGFSHAARQSTSFVALKDPMYLDPRYETIPQVGMIRMELCYNQTHLDILQDLNVNDFRLEGGRLELGAQPRSRNADSKYAEPHEYYKRAADEFAGDDDEIDPSMAKKDKAHCIVHRLTSDDIHDDTMYTVSQATSFLSVALGGFVTICLTFSAFWKTINLRPIGGGFLLAYFLQSFTFLIFDSNLCKDNMGCSMSGGATYAALASACWILACAATARMDRRKFRNQEKEQAALEEQYREFRRSENRNSRRIDEEKIYPDDIEASKATKKSRKSKRLSAETANLSSDESSTSNSVESEKILQDLKEAKEDPIYIPALPESPPNSDRSLKVKSKNDGQNGNDVAEKPKKPKSKKSKSKSKSKKNQILESSSSLSTNDDSMESPKTSKKRIKKGKKSQHIRSLSPTKSIDMAGDVVDTVDVVEEHVKDIIKNSAWAGDRTTNEIINDTKVKSSKSVTAKKSSSSSTRRSKSTPRPKNAAMRASVRQSILEGKHYEI